MWRTKILEMFGIPPLMPGTPIINTGDAGTPSTCRIDAGNDATGNIMRHQDSESFEDLTVEHCTGKIQENILCLDQLVELNVLTVKDAVKFEKDKEILSTGNSTRHQDFYS